MNENIHGLQVPAFRGALVGETGSPPFEAKLEELARSCLGYFGESSQVPRIGLSTSGYASKDTMRLTLSCDVYARGKSSSKNVNNCIHRKLLDFP